MSCSRTQHSNPSGARTVATGFDILQSFFILVRDNKIVETHASWSWTGIIINPASLENCLIQMGKFQIHIPIIS